MNDVLLGSLFLDKNNVVVDCKRRLLRFLDFTFFIHSLNIEGSEEENFSIAKNKFSLILEDSIELGSSAFYTILVHCLDGEDLKKLQV